MKLTEKLAEKSRLENTRNTALEKIASRLSTKTERKENSALVVESSGQCPDCGKPMENSFGDGVNMKVCISCRVALPCNRGIENV